MDAGLERDLAALESLLANQPQPPEGAEAILGALPGLARLRAMFGVLDKLNSAASLDCDFKQADCLQRKIKLALEGVALAATLTETQADDNFVALLQRLASDETAMTVLAAVLARVLPLLESRDAAMSDDEFRFAFVKALTRDEPPSNEELAS